MPTKHEWTEAEDALVRLIGTPEYPFRSDVAKKLGLCSWTVRDRMREIGHWPEALARPIEDDELDDPRREPLAAGHYLSWGVITAGTCLEGVPFR